VIKKERKKEREKNQDRQKQTPESGKKRIRHGDLLVVVCNAKFLQSARVIRGRFSF
jgi:hypothetical protein